MNRGRRSPSPCACACSARRRCAPPTTRSRAGSRAPRPRPPTGPASPSPTAGGSVDELTVEVDRRAADRAGRLERGRPARAAGDDAASARRTGSSSSRARSTSATTPTTTASRTTSAPTCRTTATTGSRASRCSPSCRAPAVRGADPGHAAAADTAIGPRPSCDAALRPGHRHRLARASRPAADAVAPAGELPVRRGAHASASTPRATAGRRTCPPSRGRSVSVTYQLRLAAAGDADRRDLGRHDAPDARARHRAAADPGFTLDESLEQRNAAHAAVLPRVGRDETRERPATSCTSRRAPARRSGRCSSTASPAPRRCWRTRASSTATGAACRCGSQRARRVIDFFVDRCQLENGYSHGIYDVASDGASCTGSPASCCRSSTPATPPSVRRYLGAQVTEALTPIAARAARGRGQLHAHDVRVDLSRSCSPTSASGRHALAGGRRAVRRVPAARPRAPTARGTAPTTPTATPLTEPRAVVRRERHRAQERHHLPDPGAGGAAPADRRRALPRRGRAGRRLRHRDLRRPGRVRRRPQRHDPRQVGQDRLGRGDVRDALAAEAATSCTGDARHLDGAARAAKILASWVYLWDVPFPEGSPLGRQRVRVDRLGRLRRASPAAATSTTSCSSSPATSSRRRAQRRGAPVRRRRDASSTACSTRSRCPARHARLRRPRHPVRGRDDRATGSAIPTRPSSPARSTRSRARTTTPATASPTARRPTRCSSSRTATAPPTSASSGARWDSGEVGDDEVAEHRAVVLAQLRGRSGRGRTASPRCAGWRPGRRSRS